ncbi:MAG: four helix bundle protein [Campylobacterota bacterium]|nr:four helix bundle protein [Campylobacterota bacterium]
MRAEKLDVWKDSCNLSVEVYKHFATSKDFGFKDQITRCSLSIPSNIAEGIEKDSFKEKVRYIEISRGSSAELITQIYIGIKINYIERELGLSWVKELDKIQRMLTNLKKSYKERM